MPEESKLSQIQRLVDEAIKEEEETLATTSCSRDLEREAEELFDGHTIPHILERREEWSILDHFKKWGMLKKR